MFQSKDLTVNVLPGRGALLGPNCRISATENPCGPRSVHPRPPRSPKTPEPPRPDPVAPPPPKPSAACDHGREGERDRGPRRAAGLEELRRELRATLGPV